MQRCFKWMLWVVISFSLVACSNPNSPKGIAKSFWDGVFAQNETIVRQFSSASTQNMIDFHTSPHNTMNWSAMKLHLGRTDIAGNQAMVHTVIEDTSNGEKYTFITYLVEENGMWRVDYVRTRKASVTSEIFANLISNLKKFNQSLQDNYDETVVGFKEAAPDIKAQLDLLTDNLAKRFEAAGANGHPHAHMQERVEGFKNAVLGVFEHNPDNTQAAPAQTK